MGNQRPILFMCAHGAMRSPVAASLLIARSGGSVEAGSAGLDPDPHMSPLAVEALEEIGLQIEAGAPRGWSAESLATSRVIWLGGPLPVELRDCDVERWEVSQEPVRDLQAARRLRHELEERIALLFTPDNRSGQQLADR